MVGEIYKGIIGMVLYPKAGRKYGALDKRGEDSD